jgi:hypothetical protein
MRGEITLMLGGIAYRLCPTFAALAALEQASGTGLFTLAKKFAAGEFTLPELVALIRAGIEGSGGQAPDDLGEQVLREGVATLTPTLTQFLHAALAGQASAGKA